MKLSTLSILFMAATLIAGCKTEGCTNPDATNWDVDADTNDGSCQFEGSVVIWYGEEVATVKSEFATAYVFYVDGELVGTQAVAMFWNAAPDCGAGGSITIEKNLGSLTSVAAVYEVIDDSGLSVWSGVLNFRANSCEALELTL
jgi:hypothetical protein